jgi:hypothetical protein
MEFHAALFAAMLATASGSTAANHAPVFDWRNLSFKQHHINFY